MKIHAAEALALLTLCSVAIVKALPGAPAKAAGCSTIGIEAPLPAAKTPPFSEAARLLADKYRITIVPEWRDLREARSNDGTSVPGGARSGDQQAA